MRSLWTRPKAWRSKVRGLDGRLGPEMRLIWFSHFIPYPPRGGHLQRSFHLLREAAQDFEVVLLAFNQLGEPGRVIERHKSALREICREVVVCELPVRWKSAPWWTRAAANTLSHIPYACQAFWSTQVKAEFCSVLGRNPGAIVHFDSTDLALYAGSSLSYPSVLNHHNCESQMMARRADQQSNLIIRQYLAAEASKLALIEKAVCPRFNVNIAVSDHDAELLRVATCAHVHVVENGTDVDYFRPENEAEEETVIFAAAFNWHPNLRAARYLLGEVWPHVKRSHRDAKLSIVGKQPPAGLLRRAARTEGVSVKADPEDIRVWLRRATVFVCPILDGGGTRLKLLDAMAMGLPIVSTTVGAEG